MKVREKHNIILAIRCFNLHEGVDEKLLLVQLNDFLNFKFFVLKFSLKFNSFMNFKLFVLKFSLNFNGFQNFKSILKLFLLNLTIF